LNLAMSSCPVAVSVAMFRMAAILVPALGNEISNTSFPLAPYADQPNNSAELQNASVRDRQNLSLESSELGGGVQARGNLRGSSANDRRSQLYAPYRSNAISSALLAGVSGVDPRCDISRGRCDGMHLGIDTNYNDCDADWKCDKSWEHSACDCAMACLNNPRCRTWVWEADDHWCWQKPRDEHKRKSRHDRISGSKSSCRHGSPNVPTTPAPVPWPVWTPAPPAPRPVRSVDPRCDTSPHSNCEGMLFGIDTNYNDCDKDWKCDKSWEHSACDCAMACYHNSRCKTWVWEADDHWCWQKPQVEHVRKFHHKRISGEEYTCHHS